MPLEVKEQGCHMPYGIIWCYLSPYTSEQFNTPHINRQVSTWFSYPGGIKCTTIDLAFQQIFDGVNVCLNKVMTKTTEW